jgi:hypothetical protein
MGVDAWSVSCDKSFGSDVTTVGTGSWAAAMMTWASTTSVEEAAASSALRNDLSRSLIASLQM